MTRMKDIIELLQEVKDRKTYEQYARELDRLNVYYFQCKDVNNKIYFVNCYNNLYNHVKCTVDCQ